MKQLLAVFFALCAIFTASAQNRDYQKEYEEFKRRSLQQYDDFRDRANATYERFMRNAWTEYPVQMPDSIPSRPEPPKPIVKEDPDTEPTSDAIPVGLIVKPTIPTELPQPVVPFPPVEPTVKPTFEFLYYGTPCAVSLTDEHRFSLKKIDENSVADAWKRLSSATYVPILSESLALRENLRLCDWGYVRLLERMTMAFFGPTMQNEARLMQMFILTQSGYKVRIARGGDKLVLLLPSIGNIYEYSYLPINNSKYYIIDSNLQTRSFHVFDREFPKERYFSLQITEEPLLAIEQAEPRTLTSKRFPDLSTTVAVNRNMIEFYNDYPLNDQWNIYAQASLNAQTKEQLYPLLRSVIEGDSKYDAANKLLNFTQTAFEYKVDEEQFGQERPLFADETIYYPFSDCEDRAIFYSVLVRDLLGLDVVLLQYPEHLATAVRFDDSSIPGDYVMLDGQEYIVCDPTYIGASVGDAMPQFKRVGASIIKIE